MTHGARRLGLLFLAVTFPAAVTLIVLGVYLLEQDRTLWAQRQLERRQQQAETAVRVLLDRLDKSLEEPPPHSLRFQLRPGSITPDDRRRVLWLPVVAGRSSESAPQFFDLETREFGGEAAKALAGYLELARSTNRATAAVALQRAARVHRGRREWDAALAAYGRMAAFEDTWVDGMPADLLARRAFCDLLEEAGRARELAVAADALASDFQAGRWTLDRTAWDLTKGDIERWTGRSVSVGDDARAFTAAAETIWREWNEGRWLTLRGVRRRAITVNDLPVTVVERQDERGAVATVLLPEAVRAALLTLPPADPVTIGRMKALFFLV